MQVDSEMAVANAHIVKIGVLASQMCAQAVLLDTYGEIFREHEGRYFRVIGLGDKIGGETVSYLEFKAVRGTPPLRVIVEARDASSVNTARILELFLEGPVQLAPRFGATTIHPESGTFSFR
jgi:hypothetical protein